jgi:hypothetical protein
MLPFLCKLVYAELFFNDKQINKSVGIIIPTKQD